jgi:hypothetical protein
MSILIFEIKFEKDSPENDTYMMQMQDHFHNLPTNLATFKHLTPGSV